MVQFHQFGMGEDYCNDSYKKKSYELLLVISFCHTSESLRKLGFLDSLFFKHLDFEEIIDFTNLNRFSTMCLLFIPIILKISVLWENFVDNFNFKLDTRNVKQRDSSQNCSKHLNCSTQSFNWQNFTFRKNLDFINIRKNSCHKMPSSSKWKWEIRTVRWDSLNWRISVLRLITHTYAKISFISF